MPIANGQILNRDNNRLLQGILDKQNVTFGQALSQSFQLTRDANNLQASQERDTIRVLDRDREFRENKFKDRRNFDRKVFSDDRAFGEGVRRFDIQDENADLSRDLQGELGRERNAIAWDRNAISRSSAASAAGERTFRTNRAIQQDADNAAALAEFDAIERNDEGLEPEEQRLRMESFNNRQLARGNKNLSLGAESTLKGVDRTLGGINDVEESDAAFDIVNQGQAALDKGDHEVARSYFSQAAELTKDNDEAKDLYGRATEGLKIAEESFTNANKVGKSARPASFKTAADAQSVADTIKKDIGIKTSFPDLYLNMGVFARRYESAEQMRNALLRKGIKGVTAEEAKSLYAAEKFIESAKATSETGISASDADAIFNLKF